MHDSLTMDRGGRADLPELYLGYRPVLIRFLTGLTNGQRQVAEDIFQETMIRAWRHLDTLPADPDGSRRWLFTVARRLVIDSVRRQQARPAEVELEDAHDVPGPDETAASALVGDAVRGAFNDLSPQHREIIRRLHLQGRTVDQVARDMNLPPGTVKSRSHYAVKALRESLERVE
jgi:RNA polymerase sigma-70 factor, ECF subfamily